MMGCMWSLMLEEQTNLLTPFFEMVFSAKDSSLARPILLTIYEGTDITVQVRCSCSVASDSD